jgi:CRISPR-associated protein Csx17
LRLLAEQKADENAKSFWSGDTFLLSTTLDEAALVEFFLRDYCPTPIIAPWNGGSGFYPKDNRDAIGAIAKGKATRLVAYRETITVAERVLHELHIKQKVTKEQKGVLLEVCRNRLSDGAVSWLDAAFILTENGPQYPPLLGTGGNDGRLDFTNNFMQRLVDVFDPSTGNPTAISEPWLRSALFGDPTTGLRKGAIGQFAPAAAGGANSESGFISDSLLNPWDFLLMIEGAVLFAGASVKRLESGESDSLSAPFCVRPVGVGYASAALADESGARPEMWIPLWNAPTGLAELLMLMSEGRAQVAGRSARNGVDFARAVASLGVDRGIAAFQRYGFQVRNGLAYFATPLDRLSVTRHLQVDLLKDCDSWLNSFRRAATSGSAPASAARTLRQLESAIFSLCKQSDARWVQDVLVALGGAEQVMARSLKWTLKAFLKPIPPLSPSWLPAANDGSAEYRLAASLASVFGKYGDVFIPLRRQLEPVKSGVKDGSLWVGWEETATIDVAWHEGNVVEALNAIMARRLLLAQKAGTHTWPDTGRSFASFADIAAFIEGRINLGRFASLLWGLVLLDWPQVPLASRTQLEPEGRIPPNTAYGLLKLCFASAPVRTVEVPLVPTIHQRTRVGQGAVATQLAAHRLRASGFTPAVEQVHQQGATVARMAAALLFPIASFQISALAEAVLRPQTIMQKEA